jgi:methyl-accepting chemotaxis protein
VADEVRKLAERTTTATKEIAGMIETIQHETKAAVDAMRTETGRVDAGVEAASKAGEVLSTIITSAGTQHEMITHIATAATEQAAATEQVNGNMDQISKMVQQSAVSAEESAKACQDLSSLAYDLQQVVSKFKVDGGNGARRRKGSAKPSLHEPESLSSPMFSAVN